MKAKKSLARSTPALESRNYGSYEVASSSVVYQYLHLACSLAKKIPSLPFLSASSFSLNCPRSIKSTSSLPSPSVLQHGEMGRKWRWMDGGKVGEEGGAVFFF